MLFRSLPSLAKSAPRLLGANHLSQRWITDAAKSSIENAIRSNDVVVFMKGTPEEPLCGFSRGAVTILTVEGVKEFKGINVLDDPELRTGIKEFSNWPTIPQVYVKGEFVGGFDILLNMHKTGELDELLVKEGLIEPGDKVQPVTSS